MEDVFVMVLIEDPCENGIKPYYDIKFQLKKVVSVLLKSHLWQIG